jgi:hypothetical protein
MNRYYWKVVLGYWKQRTGYDKREIHETLANYFLPDVDDRGDMTRESTAGLDPQAFADYVDDCRRLMAERYDIYIPDPNEVRLD